jgi:hypothetical protein
MIIISLLSDPVTVEDLVLKEETVHIVTGILDTDIYETETKMLAILRDLLTKAGKTPDFNWNDNVIVVARSSALSMALITGIKAAFTNVQVWLLHERMGKPTRINLSQFETEGMDFRNQTQKEVMDKITSLGTQPE